MQDNPRQLEHRQLELHAKYMQFSKKIVVAAIAGWVLAWVCALTALLFFPVSLYVADTIRAIIGYTATLTGTVVVAYMGNSSIEKYARFKYDYEAASRRDPGASYTQPPTTLYRQNYNDPGLG